MKILVITGSYPPDKCGVGDYTFHLVKFLSRLPDLEVGLMTSTYPTEDYLLDNVTILHNLYSWRLRNIFKIKKLIAEYNPNIVHIQYPTTGYNGIVAKYLPILCKAMGIKVVQTWHEHYISCGAIGWPNVLACDALVYVRPDLTALLPNWVKRWLYSTPKVYVPNTATIPVVFLDKERTFSLKQKLSKGKTIVCFFGFANKNKGIESLFDIVNPDTQHLVLICDVSDKNQYQAKILDLIKQDKWINNVTVTGFLSNHAVGEILAVADAVLFPFPDGAGVWNTSFIAARNSGVFTVATSKQSEMLGYHSDTNTYFCACTDILAMRQILNKYIGTRIEPKITYGWENIIQSHLELYLTLLSRS